MAIKQNQSNTRKLLGKIESYHHETKLYYTYSSKTNVKSTNITIFSLLAYPHVIFLLYTRSESIQHLVSGTVSQEHFRKLFNSKFSLCLQANTINASNTWIPCGKSHCQASSKIRGTRMPRSCNCRLKNTIDNFLVEAKLLFVKEKFLQFCSCSQNQPPQTHGSPPRLQHREQCHFYHCDY